MNQWLEKFNIIKQEWENYNFKGLSAHDKSNAQEVQLIARAKKISKIIDDLLESADPELIPTSIYDNIINNKFIYNLNINYNNYENHKHINYLTNINNYLDAILQSLRPYLYSEKKSAKAAGHAFKEYANTVQDFLVKLEEKSSHYFNQIEKYLEEVEGVKQEAIQKAEILYKGKKDSILSLAKKSHEEITKIKNEIIELYGKLFGGDGKEGIYNKIIHAYNDVQKISEDSKKYMSDIEGHFNELENYYSFVFGKEQYDEDGKPILNENGDIMRVGGLALELQNKRKELKEMTDFYKNQLEELSKQINDLLPGATTAGLSTAFKESKELMQQKIKNYNIIFLASILLISLILIFTFFDVRFDKGISIEFHSFKSAQDAITGLVYRISSIFALLWIAMHANKKVNEFTKLEQEYTHKEVVARSFYSYKTQIENLGENSKELLEKLMGVLVDTTSHNPINHFDKSNLEKPWFFYILDSLKGKNKGSD